MLGIWGWIGIIAVSYCIHEIRQRNHALDDDEPPEPQSNIDDYMSDYDKAIDEESNEPTPTINVQTSSAMSDNYYEKIDTPALVKTLLGKLNCQVDEEDDGTLFFTYQGERFIINCSNDSLWISIVDGQWYDCPLENLEEISCMQKAINVSNARNVCTAIYNIDNERNTFSVYSKFDAVISPQFPSPDRLLAAWLGSFFQLKHTVVMEFEKEKQRIGINN